MIKLTPANAKRLGYKIDGYEIAKDKKTPQPIISKKSPTLKKKKGVKKECIPLIKCGNIDKLDIQKALNG